MTAPTNSDVLGLLARWANVTDEYADSNDAIENTGHEMRHLLEAIVQAGVLITDPVPGVPQHLIDQIFTEISFVDGSSRRDEEDWDLMVRGLEPFATVPRSTGVDG